MFKRLALPALLATIGLNAHAVGPGDLAFSSFNSQEDGWSMVALTAISANTVVYFTDNEWNGSAIGAGGAFNTGESYSQWDTGSATIAAGTVIRFSNVDALTLAASVGSFTRATVSGSTNYGISATADTVYAYVGSAAATPTTFIAAVTNAPGAFTSATDGVLTNTGLAAGVSAIALAGGTQFSEYTGSRSGATSFAAYLPSLTNAANWSTSVANAAAVPNTATFSVSAVPEPESYALLLAGLGVVGFCAKRRSPR